MARYLPANILAVDDDSLLLKIMSEILQEVDYQVDTAEDGAAGWKKLQGARYDLLITDNSMPKMTGLELIKKIRAAGMVLPIILSSSAMPNKTEELRLAAYLEKPYSPDKLLQTVKAALLAFTPENFALQLKPFVRHLLANEATPAQIVGTRDSAAFRVCEKLHMSLVTLMGVGGFTLLLSRAVALAGADVAWLLTLKVEADGTVTGWVDWGKKPEVCFSAEGEVVLVAHLLGLLVTFIGSSLTLSLLQEIWPKLDAPGFLKGINV